MESVKKIFTEEHLIYDEFILLKKTQDLIKIDKIDSDDLRAIYNNAFSVIIALGYPTTKVNDYILNINGSSLDLHDYSFNANIEELIKNEPDVKAAVDASLAGEFFFKTDKEIKKEKEAEERIRAEEEKKRLEAEAEAKRLEEEKKAEEMRKAEEERKHREEEERLKAEAEEEKKRLEEEARFKAEEEAKRLEEERIKAEEEAKAKAEEESNNDDELFGVEDEPVKEPQKPKYPFGIKDVPEELKETNERKFLDTMWFVKSHIVVQNKDTGRGLGRTEFDITLFPINLPPVEHTMMPVRHIAVIYNCSDDRYKYELPGDSAFGEIEYENYVFRHNIRFGDDGHVLVAINPADANAEYMIITKDDEEMLNYGIYKDEHLNKFVRLGDDTLDIYPLYDSNSEKKGTCTCLVIKRDKEGNEFTEISSDMFLWATSSGNKNVLIYWGTENDKKVLKVDILDI